jgi:hypothetical protein
LAAVAPLLAWALALVEAVVLLFLVDSVFLLLAFLLLVVALGAIDTTSEFRSPAELIGGLNPCSTNRDPAWEMARVFSSSSSWAGGSVLVLLLACSLTGGWGDVTANWGTAGGRDKLEEAGGVVGSS